MYLLINKYCLVSTSFIEWSTLLQNCWRRKKIKAGVLGFKILANIIFVDESEPVVHHRKLSQTPQRSRKLTSSLVAPVSRLVAPPPSPSSGHATYRSEFGDRQLRGKSSLSRSQPTAVITKPTRITTPQGSPHQDLQQVDIIFWINCGQEKC